MPYTLSHAAAVLPFSRPLARLRLLSATVIGSLVPDFSYLLPFDLSRAQTHSALSLLTFSLPIGMLCYWIFQGVIKRPLFAVLPDQTYLRWRAYEPPTAITSPREWLLAACGVVFGALTHLVWDGFTHEGARGMRMLPELDDWKIALHGHHLIGARLLQGMSSLLGLAIVLAVLLYALRGGQRPLTQPRALQPAQRRNWLLGYAIAIAIFSVEFDLLDHVGAGTYYPSVPRANELAVAFMRGLALAALIVSVCLGIHLRAKRRSHTSVP